MTRPRTVGEATHVDVPDLIAPRLHLGRWVSGLLVAALAVGVGVSVFTNPNIDHATVKDFFFSPAILTGLGTTILLAVVAQALGIVIGLLVALLRMSRNPVAAVVGWVYVWLFRGIPLLVQVLIWGNFALFYRRIDIGIPGTDVLWASWDTNAVLTPFVASLLALSLNEAAYMAEIIRGGMLSVATGQHEAARALGLSRSQALVKVILPQVLRVIIPPTGNQFINMLKMTSLVSVIAGGDLLTQAQNIAAGNLQTMELLFVASGWYLVCTTIASIAQSILERRFDRGHRRAGWWARMLGSRRTA
ncbi:amino acid ABC transporter permease [Microbacterium luticocti]|uniref:amino acid ABC transporter permease n=1 Tax=Microbacterium luticocti TaxID=451764 RepID=UPI00146F81D0|nr:amino acid ABC transporter permease [Microbacterium luticocti]